MGFAGEPVSGFVAPDGRMRYSVRRRQDGLFQIVHDGATLDDGSQPWWMEDRILSGIFATAELAETELIQMIDASWTRVT